MKNNFHKSEVSLLICNHNAHEKQERGPITPCLRKSLVHRLADQDQHGTHILSRILMRLGFVVLIFTASSNQAISQVINNDINWEVKLVDWDYTGETEPGFGNTDYQDEPTFLFHAHDNTQALETDILGHNFWSRPAQDGFDHVPHPGVHKTVAYNKCFPVDNVFCFGPIYPFGSPPQSGTTIRKKSSCANSDIPSTLTISLRAWEDDSYDVASGPIPDMFGPARYIINSNEFDVNATNGYNFDDLDPHRQYLGQFNGNFQATLAYGYVYVNGNGIDQPLTFGELPYAQTRTHKNRTSNELLIPGEFDWDVHECIGNINTNRFYSFTVPEDGAQVNINILGDDGRAFGVYVKTTTGTASLGFYLSNGIYCKKHPLDDTADPYSTYIIQVGESNNDPNFTIELTASPSPGCVEPTDYSGFTDNYGIYFGLPDQSNCAVNQPYQLINAQNLSAVPSLLDNLIDNTALRDYPITAKGETSLHGLFVEFYQPIIGLDKTINVYHYRQNTNEDTATDTKGLNLIENRMVSAGSAAKGLNYAINPPSGSDGDAILYEIYTGSGNNKIFIASPLLVTGVDIVSDSLGETVVPNKVDLILYDPPGDSSQAGFESSYSVCRTETTQVSATDGSNRDLKASIGVKGSAGFIVELEYELSTSFNSNVSEERESISSNQFTKCVKATTQFETSPELARIGADGDIFIGSGEQWIWGIQDSIGFDESTCSLTRDSSFVAAINSVSQFAWDRLKVVDEMNELETAITGLQSQINANPNIDNAIKLDKSRKEEQLRVWQNIMLKYEAKRNDDQNNIIGNPFNWSGPNVGAMIETDVTEEFTEEYNIILDKSTGQDVVAMLGANGIEGGFEINVNNTKSNSIDSLENTLTVISYFYSDTAGDDPGDTHTGVITRDPDFGTHIFHLGPGTSTSCPYEGGYQRYQPALSIEDNRPCQNGIISEQSLGTVNVNDTLRLRLNVCNESNERKGYLIKLIDNPNSAKVNLNGNLVVGSVAEYPDIGPEECVISGGFKPLLEVWQDNGQTEQYLRFLIYPDCWGDNVYNVEAKELVLNITFGQDLNDDDCDQLPNDIDLCPSDANISLNFDGDYDHVQVPHDVALNVGAGDFTLQAWVYPTGNNVYQTILCKGTGFGMETDYIFTLLSVGNMNALSFYLEDEGHNVISTLVPSNAWSHVAVTYNATTKLVSFYIDGVASETVTFINAPTSSDTGPLFIGQFGSQVLDFNFEGRLDDVLIWNRGLSPLEIQNSMAAPIDPTAPGLVAYYQFNDGLPCITSSQTTAADAGPLGNTGTLMNFSLANDCVSNWTSGRNLDSDGDGIGDACDDYDYCPDDLANLNKLSGDVDYMVKYETSGLLESQQHIISPADIQYDSGLEISLLSGFEVNVGAVFHAYIDGCGNE